MSNVVADTKRKYRMRLRTEQSNTTAGRIRDEAWQRFSTRPYDEVTLAEIATAAGVTVPTVIAHFGHKEDLFLASFIDWAERAVELREKVTPGDPVEAVRNLLGLYEAEGHIVLLLLAEEDRFPAVREMTDEGRAYHRIWVEEIFEPNLKALDGAARERRVVQLVVATDLLTWKLIRRDAGLSAQQTEETIVEMVRTLTEAA